MLKWLNMLLTATLLILILAGWMPSFQNLNLDNALQYIQAHGYVAYATPAGDLYANNIYPNANNSYDFGTNTNRWRNYYGAGTIYATAANVTTANATTINATTVNAATFNGNLVGNVTGNVSGTTVTATGNVTGGNLVTTGNMGANTITVSSNALVSNLNSNYVQGYTALQLVTGLFGGDSWVISNNTTASEKAAAAMAKLVFGAKVQICDYSDDQIEILAAINAQPVGGGVVWLSYGWFRCSANITISGRDSLTIRGAGAGHDVDTGATMVNAFSNNMTVFHLINTRYVNIESMAINGAGMTGTIGIHQQSGILNTYRDLLIDQHWWGARVDFDHSNKFERVRFLNNGEDSNTGAVSLGTSTTVAGLTTFDTCDFTGGYNGLVLVRTAQTTIRGSSAFEGIDYRGIWFKGYTPTSTDNDVVSIYDTHFEANGTGGAPFTNMRDIDISYGRYVNLYNVRVTSALVDYQLYTGSGTAANNINIYGGLGTGTSQINSTGLVTGYFRQWWKSEAASDQSGVIATEYPVGGYNVLKPSNVLTALFGRAGWKPYILLSFLEGTGKVTTNLVDSWVDGYKNGDLVGSPAWGTAATGWGKVNLTGADYAQIPRTGVSNDVTMSDNLTIVWAGVPNFAHDDGSTRYFWYWRYNDNNRIYLFHYNSIPGFGLATVFNGTAKTAWSDNVTWAVGDSLVTVATVDKTAGIMKLYANGKLLDTVSGLGTCATNAATMYIGTSADTPGTLGFVGSVSFFEVLKGNVPSDADIIDISKRVGSIVLGQTYSLVQKGATQIDALGTSVTIVNNLGITPKKIIFSLTSDPGAANAFWATSNSTHVVFNATVAVTNNTTLDYRLEANDNE